MRVVLFIGHHKVGTSSLQRYLSENYHAFLEAGVLYPMVDFEGFSIQMARGAKNLKETPALTFNAREAHNALAFKMMAEGNRNHKVPNYHNNLPHTRQMFHAIHSQMRSLNPHTVVLCAEVFANFAAVDQSLIRNLAEEFSPEYVTVISTLRRPDEYITSWQGQRLKFGHRMEPLSGLGLDHYFPTIHFDYRKMLEGWTRVFDPQVSDWIVRDYADVLNEGGSVEDFMKQAGIVRAKGAIEVPDSNPSIPSALMEIARLGNNQLPRVDAQALRRYLLQAGDRLALPKKEDIEFFGAANRNRLLEQFQPIHEWIENLTGTSAFFRNMEDAAAVRPITATDAALSVIDDLRVDAAKHLYSDAAQEFLAKFSIEDM